MKIALKATTAVMEDGRKVLKLTPSVTEALNGETVSGELFVNLPDNSTALGYGDEITIDLPEEPATENPA